MLSPIFSAIFSVINPSASAVFNSGTAQLLAPLKFIAKAVVYVPTNKIKHIIKLNIFFIITSSIHTKMACILHH